MGCIVLAYHLHMPFKHYVLLVCAAVVLYACKHFKLKPVPGDNNQIAVTLKMQENYSNAIVNSGCNKALPGLAPNADNEALKK